MSHTAAQPAASDLRPTPDVAARYALARNTALVAGAFSAVVCVLLLADFARRTVKDPFEAPQFKALKAQLAAESDNETLKEQIRSLDLELRQQHFRHRRFAAFGAVLLLGGVAVTLAAGKWASALRRRLPHPGPQSGPHDAETGVMEVARVAVAALAGLLIGAAVIAGLAFPTLVTEDQAAAVALPASAPADGNRGTANGQQPEPKTPTPKPAHHFNPEETPAETRARSWPRFRGPGGAGISAFAAAPTAWDDKSGKGIAWKTPVPLAGNNSPIVWKDRVFLSGADEKRREVYCFEAASGKLVWQRDVPGTPESTGAVPEVFPDTGFAAPTMATDGRSVFAIFANGDVAALDFEGKLVWARSLGIPKDNHYGHAASLETHEKLLFVQMDQGQEKEKKSRLLALDTATGQTVWEKPREVAVGWATPALVEQAGKPQLITAANPWIISYRPADGEVLWRAKLLGGEHGVSPVCSGGVVQVGSEYSEWFAVRADGEGDVTKTHLLWKGSDGLPDQCSPLVTDKHVFLLMSYGTLTCYDAKKGDVLWSKDFDGVKFTSSPGMAGGRVYLFGDVETEEKDAEGNPRKVCKTWILEPTDQEAKEVGTCQLEEGCVTSPAFQDGRIYIRGSKHLFCLGETK